MEEKRIKIVQSSFDSSIVAAFISSSSFCAKVLLFYLSLGLQLLRSFPIAAINTDSFWLSRSIVDRLKPMSNDDDNDEDTDRDVCDVVNDLQVLVQSIFSFINDSDANDGC